ncbi:MAG TPA: formate dehydrogenase subunit gamma [Pyrinomonadaceae bacterium]|jgi:formate dehydrogenase subunit gamma|nr:formate dehydrogenase subunit gamma [Pyrinomonadaceae bacterium]
MSTSAERFDERARREAARHGRTVVHQGELLRHPVYTRLLHWLVAISFVLSLLSGFAIYSPWLFRWLTPLFGGGPLTRLLHPWFGLAFDLFFCFQFVNWFAPMLWTESDRRWIRRLRDYITNREKREPGDVGFFNGGQKLYFWAIVGSGLLFLVTGLLMWFDNVVPRWLVALSYVVHDIAALVMLGGFIIHVYEGTAAQPGTFRAMTDGTVTEEWAWTHHPAWYKEATGRDPREDYERESRRQQDRARAAEAEEREQDARARRRNDEV